MAKILIADSIAKEGIDLLSRQHEVVVKTGLSEDALVEAVANVQALVVRSQTQVTARVIEAGQRLEVIARAGVGVDNVDVGAATARGVVVVNAPLANTISTAEHAFGLMLAVARNIPQGQSSLKAGKWERSKLQGVELAGKTLGVVGLGRIGAEVASRARAFQMRVIAFDPFVSMERASSLGIEMKSLDEVFAESDFVTLHTTLTPETRGMISKERLAKARKGIRIINAARGALIDEQALFDAVDSGHIAGAGIDVFSEEPAVGNILTTHDRIVVTPHLAASTNEAQDRAAVDVAEQVLDILGGKAPRFPVNVPTVNAESMAVIAPYIEAARVAGRVAMQLAQVQGRLEKVRIEYRGEVSNHDVMPLKAAAVVGLLDEATDEKVSAVNALSVAEQRGLRIEEDKGAAEEPYASLVTVAVHTDAGVARVSATHTAGGCAIVAINDYRVDVRGDSQTLLAIENMDKPGSIGRVGTLMGQRGVNISSMSVSPSLSKPGHALMLLGVDRSLAPDELGQVRALDGIEAARQIRL